MFRSFILSSALLAMRATAQLTASPYVDADTGITFNTYQHTTGYSFGIALPETPTTDFIGQIKAPIGGWAGVSMGSSMAGNLHVVAWPNEGEIMSSFRRTR
jgi:cellobiose dehydrogenase (acceptor)